MEEAQHVYPSNGGWDGQQTILASNNAPFSPNTFDFEYNQLFIWGVGDPARGPTDQTGSWGYSILPFIEQGAMYNIPDWKEAVATYICPERRLPIAATVVAEDAYGTYTGGGWTWGKTDYAANLFVFDNRPNVPEGFAQHLRRPVQHHICRRESV